jgi:type IV secretion system protein VirD4
VDGVSVFALFVQSLSQLNEKYGHDVARIIRGNCEIWIYLQANDLETLEEISKKLGRYTVSTHSAGSSSSKYSSASQSENISLMGRELLTTGEVRTITAPYALILSKHALR